MTVAVSRVEYRCKGKVHGVRKVYPDGKVYVEIRCKDHWCTDREPGVVVFHYFDPETGELHHTQKYSSAKPTKSERVQLESNCNER
ncbi:hypothetical protein PBI_ROPE_23 [Mycobacterium phage Rope]|uniref:Uncharacterized protein n=3 Tax=Papyrusvirus TaxID=1982554 RepID=A0A120HUJ6_9CAUD|nr:hypothetical protein SEA_WEISS13_23 [Mycobacterium phage Weiss13]AYQ98597.1 hypothetical protein SEA_RIPARIAN_23 [Mycobacterium phage Riparian]QNN99683.1 hypothetical protein PBI_ROPE_23 [Mycobacterium phage Rope]